MHLITASDHLSDYLVETNTINYSDRLIQKKAEELFHPNQNEIEKAKIAFEFVRDHFAHS
ncbi:hypothetical protein GGQ92_000025 [Gracilibacillus halotolerans]|uniref:Uncharacterized protein n=1 Tax=Gracilibacillus halotolerans TaxID=74386 RepID=A0A841RKI7_9BACI|nr:hypothetical protein [Gracilibacillus halotolerans]